MASIAAPSMSCEANRPLTSHSERNRNQTRAKNYPAFTMPACLLTVTGRCMRRCRNRFTFYLSVFGCRTWNRTTRVFWTADLQSALAPYEIIRHPSWLRRSDLNTRPLVYGASELPDCSTAQFWREGTDSNRRLSFVQCRVATARHVSRERSNLLSYPLVVFRLPFVKERWYYRIRHRKSQWQKYTLPFVVGRAFRCGGMNRRRTR